jgi:hypothetical protein
MHYSVYEVLGVNSGSWQVELERNEIMLRSVVMVELKTKHLEMRGDVRNYHENLILRELRVQAN